MVTFFKSILRRRLRGTFKINWNNCNLGQRLPLRLHIYAVTKPLIVILYWGSNRKSHFPPSAIVCLPCHLIPVQKVLLTLILWYLCQSPVSSNNFFGGNKIFCSLNFHQSRDHSKKSAICIRCFNDDFVSAGKSVTPFIYITLNYSLSLVWPPWRRGQWWEWRRWTQLKKV